MLARTREASGQRGKPARSLIVAFWLLALSGFCLSQAASSSSCAEEQSIEPPSSPWNLLNDEAPQVAPQEEEEEEEEEDAFERRQSSAQEGCGAHFVESPFSSLRVAGGYEAQPGEFPSFVQLIISKSSGKTMLCGGALISRRLVLTAAHCVRGWRSALARPTLKDVDASSLVDWIPVAKFCPSSLNQPRSANYDLAVVRLKREVELSRQVQTACLPTAAARFDTKAYAIGLGRNWGTQRPKTLQVLPVKKSICPRLSDVHASKICFVASDKRFRGNVCQGDSGGPVIALQDGKHTVFGLVSYKHQDVCWANLDTQAVYLDVFNTRQEINKLMELCERP